MVERTYISDIMGRITKILEQQYTNLAAFIRK